MYNTSQFNDSVYGKESLQQVEIRICSVSLLWSQWWFPLWPFLGSSISNGEMWVEGKLIEGVLRVLITSYTFRCLVQLMMGHLWTDVWWNCMIWKLIFLNVPILFQLRFNLFQQSFNWSAEAMLFSAVSLLFAWISLEMPKTEKSAREWKRHLEEFAQGVQFGHGEWPRKNSMWAKDVAQIEVSQAWWCGHNQPLGKKDCL